MPAFSDYLLRTSPSIIQPNLFVRLHNNVTNADYISDGVTDANGKYTLTAQRPPAGSYTVFTGPTGTFLGTPTSTGDANYIVPAKGPQVSDGSIFVSGLGNDLNDGVMMGEGLATLSAALLLMGQTRKGTIWLGLGTFDVLNGLSLLGYRCAIRGMGPGSIILASTQTGPVLDLSGWISQAAGVVEGPQWGDFTITGSGVATATLHGMRIGTSTIPTGTRFTNITIGSTGGVPLWLDGGCNLNTFENVILLTPAGANANNVPYLKLVGAANGNRFFGCALWNVGSTTDAVGGDLVMVDDGAQQPTLNGFIGCFSEGMRIPTNGTIISCKGTQNEFRGWEFFDQQRVAAATGTSLVAFLATFNGVAGNTWDGTVPGNQSATDPQIGIDVFQSGTVIKGLRGYTTTPGSSVRLNAGVGHCHVDLQGTALDGSSSGVTDNSGVTTNFIHDRDVMVMPSPMTIRDLLTTQGNAYVVFAGVNAGTSPPTPTAAGSNSGRGEVLWGTGTGPTAGGQVDVYPVAQANALHPVFTPTNAATAALQPYISFRGTDHITIALGIAPAAGQATGTYRGEVHMME